MKTKLFYRIFTFLVLAFIFSCTDEKDKFDQTGTVNFTTENQKEVEAATAPLSLNIGIDNYYNSGGTIHVEATGGVYGQDYKLSTGSPSFDLTVQPGGLVATFSVIPINNTVINPDLDITFTITKVTGGLQLGNKKTLKFTILNDDNPQIAAINFETTPAVINENDANYLPVKINFNKSSTLGGTVNISAVGNAVFGTDYEVMGQTSAPFTVNVPAGANSAEFKMRAVNNSIVNVPRAAVFKLESVTGGLQIQSPNTFTVNISDDDLTIIPINYIQDFESASGLTTLGYTVQSINQPAGITAAWINNTTAAGYSNVNDPAQTSDNGVQLAINATSASQYGNLDQVLISPSMNGTGNIAFTLDYSYAFAAQNNSTITFYWTQNYSGGTFNPANWTVLGTDTAAQMAAAGTAQAAYKRRTFNISTTAPFYVAVRVNQTIDATYYRMRWRVDNIKLKN